ncbi:MAG: PQQ-like beta-propeller repeat protein [Planctomycetes bacterium]|nr:PQQ-like beta-propeller repeat protein [Planctomycetota bacterium]
MLKRPHFPLSLALTLTLCSTSFGQSVDDWRTDIGAWPVYLGSDSTQHVYAIDGGFNVFRLDPDGNLLWTRRYDVGAANNHEKSFQFVIDSQDAVIVAGYSEDTGEFMTVKWNTQGVRQWVHLFRDGLADEAYKIGIDADDNVYVTGHSLDGSTFIKNFMTLSIDPVGNTRWFRRHALGGTIQPTAIAVNLDGRCGVVGHSGGGTVVAVTYDRDGNQLWAQTYYPVLIAANSAAMASDGAIYISGVSVNGGHIMCYGPTGILEWQFEHDRPGFPIWSNYRRIKVDSQDRVVACGQADGLGGYTDWSTVCVDRAGNLIWEDYVNGFESNDEWAEALAIGSDDSVYVGGKICNNSTSSWMHGLVVKWDRNGQREWEHHYEGLGGGTITRSTVEVDGFDRVLAVTTWVTRVSQANKLQLEVQNLIAGSNVTLSARQATWQKAVHFAFSLKGMGDGPCPTALGGLCLDLLAPVRKIGTVVADASGFASFTATVPPTAIGMAVHFQAVEARGIGGTSSVSSNVVSTSVK